MDLDMTLVKSLATANDEPTEPEKTSHPADHLLLPLWQRLKFVLRVGQKV